MIKELNHIGILSTDIEKSIDFYANILGAEIVRDATSPDGKSRFVYLQIVDGIIELIQSGDPASAGLAHIAFILDDNVSIDDAYDKLSGMGYEFTVLPKVAASGDGKLAFFKDSSNCVFEILERKTPVRESFKNPHILEFDHLSVQIFDACANQCDQFYLGIMGFKVRKIMQKDNFKMCYYSHGKDTLETLHSIGGDVPSKALQHLAFRVADVSKIKGYLVSKGIECPNPIKQSSFGGFNILNIVGPDGVAIEFVDRPALENYDV